MATIAVRRPAASPLRRQETRAGLLFILPWIIALLVFTAYPTIATFYLSFTEYNIVQPPSWIGLDNYRTIFSEDPAFWTAVRNSAIYALISVPLKLVIAFGLALLLNMGVRGIGVYRTIFYLPTLVPPIAATIIFILLFSPGGGPINTIIGWLGLRAPDWLNDPHWALPALIVLGIWPLGVETLAFLAGLKEIPQDLLDAAAVDGAEGWQRLRHVIIPLISPVILFNLVIGVIYSFQVFTQALVMFQVKVAKYAQALSPAIEVIAAVGVAATLLFAYRAHISKDDFLGVITALFLAYEPIKKLGALNTEIRRAGASLDRLEVVLHEPVTITDPAEPVTAGRLQGTLAFERVSFSYKPGDPVLHDVSVTIPAGAASAPISVVPIDDTIVEPNETVIVTLSAPDGYVVGFPGSGAVTIVSDDVPPDLVVTAMTVPAIGGANGTISATDTTKNQGSGSSDTLTSGDAICVPSRSRR